MKKPKQFKPVRREGKTFSGEKKETGRTKGYSVEWEKYRWRFLHHNPRCYACGRDKTSMSIHIDHIVAHKGNEELFWNETNYIPLCHSCHSIVTGRYDKYNPPKTEEKMKWLESQRDLWNVEIKVKVVPLKRRKVRGS